MSEQSTQIQALNPDDWAIDKTAGCDILVYKSCSVIEDEQAHALLALIRAQKQAVAQDVPKVQQTAPAEIHLNIGPDAQDCDFKDLHDVTWCDHDATDGSVRYVRADLAAPLKLPQGLHPRTADLVLRFAGALAEKLYASEVKRGYSDGWASPDWLEECRAELVRHVAKGDPRDVAAYCAFLWHHGAKTELAAAQQGVQPVATRYRFILNEIPQKWEVGQVEMMDNPDFLEAQKQGKFEMHPLYTHPTTQGLDAVAQALANAFITSESDGATGSYKLVAKFKTLQELQAAHKAVVAAIAAQAKQAVDAQPIGQLSVSTESEQFCNCGTTPSAAMAAHGITEDRSAVIRCPYCELPLSAAQAKQGEQANG